MGHRRYSDADHGLALQRERRWDAAATIQWRDKPAATSSTAQTAVIDRCYSVAGHRPPLQIRIFLWCGRGRRTIIPSFGGA